MNGPATIRILAGSPPYPTPPLLPVGVMYSVGSAYPPESPGPFLASRATDRGTDSRLGPRLQQRSTPPKHLIVGTLQIAPTAASAAACTRIHSPGQDETLDERAQAQEGQRDCPHPLLPHTQHTHGTII